MPLVDDLAERLEIATTNHIRFHNRSDADLLQLRREYWRLAAEAVELLITEAVEQCLKTPRKK